MFFASTVSNNFQNIPIILECHILLPIYISRICMLSRLEIFKVNKNNFFTGSQTYKKPNTSWGCLEKEIVCARPQNN